MSFAKSYPVWRLPTGVVLLALIGLSSCFAVAQQFNEAGSYTTSSYQSPVTLALASGKTQQAGVTLTYPTAAEAGPFPLVIAFNGFQCQAAWYSEIATRIASWGYVVLQYDLSAISELTHGDKEEATYLQPLLDWLALEADAGSNTPASGLVDFSRKAVLGHSRGGKLAALHYATRDDIQTAVLLDPVDCFIPGPDYPSAVAALAGLQASCGESLPPLKRSEKKAAVIGAGHVALVPCNPPKYNYATFTNVLGAGTWKVLIKQAGHMQFPYSTDLAYRALDATCGKGDIPTQDVVDDARTFAVAWLETQFRAEQSGPRLQAFLDWVEARMADSTISFETLVAEKAGVPLYVVA